MIGTRPDRTENLHELAAYWDARLRTPTADHEDRRNFGVWLAADPTHKQAFDRLQASLSMLRDAASGHPELRAMRDAAHEATSPSVHWRRFGSIAAALALAVGGLTMLSTYDGITTVGKNGAAKVEADQSSKAAPLAANGYAEQKYQTMLGERSVITLADGSRITLNTSSRIAVRLQPHRRDVVVLAGQALFEVARDPARPFVVRAGERTVTAHGTAFDVRLKPDGVEVTLIEGRVTVAKAIQGAVPVQIANLTPGQQLIATGAQALVRTIDAEKETSWRDGRVFFNDQPLTSAIDEMNRYSPVKIIADPSLAALRINGMFRAGQQVNFARTLEAYLPMKAEIVNENRIELRSR